MAGPDAAITLFSQTALNLVVLSPERQVIRAVSDQGPAEEWELQISVGHYRLQRSLLSDQEQRDDDNQTRQAQTSS